jgi:hypothetical protein
MRNSTLEVTVLTSAPVHCAALGPGYMIKFPSFVEVVILAAFATGLLSGCQPTDVGTSPAPSHKESPLATSSSKTTPNPSPSPSRPLVPHTSLQISGTLSATTDPAAGENSCFYGQPFAGSVRTSTPAMALPDGQALRVFLFSPLRMGSYEASSPGGDGRAIVRAVRSTRMAGGGDSGDWFAVSGTLTITQTMNLGDGANWGVIAGNIDATLTWTNGSDPITVRGAWGCVIDPVANA